MKHFIFNNNSILSENFRYLNYRYIFHCHVNIDVIMKRINNYYIQLLTEEQAVIIAYVHGLIKLKDDALYRSYISTPLFELCCK